MNFKRIIEVNLVILIFVFLLPLFFSIALIIKFTSKGNVIYWSKRIGQDNKVFMMAKFRSMITNAKEVDSNNFKNPDVYITKVGRFLRKTSLDEVPQLWNIFIGDMTFIGPRPALHTQYELIKLRRKYSIHHLKPGITGLAQINGRDFLTIKEKVAFDREYLIKKNFFLNLKILLLTLRAVFLIKNIRH